MKRFWTGICTLLVAVQLHATDLAVSAVEVIGHGIFEASSTGKRAIRTPGAVPAEIVMRPRFLEITDEIPARVGTSFGFEYLINTTPRGQQMKIRAVINFPGDGLITPSGKIYKQSIERLPVVIGERNLYGYGFDDAWELVPGDWVFQIWYQDFLLLEKTFHVVLN